jgi:hypothetical protein
MLNAVKDLAVLLLWLPAAVAQQPGSSDVSSQLRGIASAGQLPELRWPDFSDYRAHVQNFYQPSGWLWCNLGLRDAKSSFASSI